MSGGYHFSKKGVDKERFLYYDSQASSKQVSADVAELADALDSGSSGHCARAGSSPVIRIQQKKSCLKAEEHKEVLQKY